MTDPVEEYMAVHNYEPWVYEGENIILWRSPTSPDMTMEQARYLCISSLEAELKGLEALLYNASGAGNWRRYTVSRIAELDRQIAAVKGEIHE